MAAASTKTFGGVQVLLETDTPDTYAAPCGITQRAITFTKTVSETLVPDCADDDAASIVTRDAVSRSVTISGEGVLAMTSLETWREFYENDDPQGVKILISGNAASGGGQWIGDFHLTSFSVTAEKGSRATVSIEMQSTGAVSWTAAAS